VLGTFEQERHRAGWDRHMRIGLRIALSEGGFTFEVKEARASKDTLFLGTSSLEEASQRIGHLAFSRSPVSNMRPFDVDAHMAEVAESFAGRFFSSLQVLRAYRVGTDERELRRVALHNVLGKMGWSEEAANCLQEESTFLAEISDVYLDARMRPVVAETFARVVKKSLR
jgi:hypothetical protein